MSAAAVDISVVVPLHNGERYVADALRSILDQTLEPTEVIVVDDGSTDRGPEVVREFGPPVRCFSLPHVGLAAGLNVGLREVRGSLIASLDADDLWTRDKLALQVAALEQDPRLDLVFGRVEQFYSPDLATSERAPVRAATGALMRSAMLARREAIERVGPFDVRWRVGDFVDWYARAVEAGLRIAAVPQLVMRRRIHASNMSRLAGDDRADYVRLVKAALDRRRARATSR